MATYNGDWNTRQSDEQGYAYDALLKALGHAPSDAQLAQATAAYQSSDPNRPNVIAGNAFVYQMLQGLTSPDQAKPQYDNVNQIFQGTLQRDATQQEKDHFGTLLANGQLDQYSLGTWLQQLPESVQKQDKTFREGLNSDLQKQDAQYYNEQIMPGISQNFAKNGRSFDSSAYQQALAQAAQGQNRQREGFLSNLTASQYGGSQANARQDYLNNIARGYQTQDAVTARGNEISNFNMQKQAYDQYLSRYGKRSNAAGIGSLAGGVLGGVAGSFSGTPFGVAAGYQMGSALGGGIGGMYGGGY